MCSFLVDTGATLSVIAKNKIPHNIILQHNNITIRGIGGNIYSHEIAELQLCLSSQTESYSTSAAFTFRFHVLNNMPCKADGIIGLDFLRMYNANIDLLNNVLTLQNNSKKFLVHMYRNNDFNKNLYLPRRSESIHFVTIQ